MSNPFDLISNELGIAQGIPREYAAQFSAQQQAAAAAAAGQQMMQMRGINGAPAPIRGYPRRNASSSSRSKKPGGKASSSEPIDKVQRRYVQPWHAKRMIKFALGLHCGSGIEVLIVICIWYRRKREREAARRSRQKKQLKMEGLSTRVEELERENAELKKQIQWSNVEALVKVGSLTSLGASYTFYIIILFTLILYE